MSVAPAQSLERTHLLTTAHSQHVALSEDEHIQHICARAPGFMESGLWTVFGEWSPARTDCAKYLNGRGRGSRYDGSFNNTTPIGSCEGMSGKASTFSPEYKVFLKKFWEAQTLTYETQRGWIQWTWKTEEADEWSYQAGLENGWIPRNPTEREYPNICG